jgi:hypothetical protein
MAIEAVMLVLFISCCLCWASPDWVAWSSRTSAIVLLMSCSVAFLIGAIRWRLMPLVGHVLALVTGLLVLLMIRVWTEPFALFDDLVRRASWAESLLVSVEGPLIVAGMVGAGITAIRRGVRVRHRYVAPLVKALTVGGLNARRKAILAFDEIAALDLASARKNGRVFELVFRRWFFPNDTPAVTPDAVSVLEAALNDDDRFVRIQAAKVLTRMGVKLDLE